MIDFLTKTGLNKIYDINEFNQKNIILRDGRNATLWVSKKDGHGILDPKYWEATDFYTEDYRNQFSANLNSYTSPDDHINIYKKINKRQFNQFKDKVSKSTKFLEIGSSFGGIIRQIDKLEIKRCDALEPNVQDAVFLRSKLKNTNVINSFFEKNDFRVKYDLVVSFEVLEHVFNLKSFLIKLFNITKKGGLINFEVPNHLDALLVNYKNDKYQSFYYHKSHVHYFTPQSLINIFSHFGFKGKVSSFQMYPFYNQIYWLYNNQPQSSATEALVYPKLENLKKTNKKINKFLKKTNKKYIKLMKKNLCGDCLIFKGYKL